MSVNKWRIDQALSSFHRLNELLPELTEEEIFACLKLEAATCRRKSIINRLISRAVRINEIRYSSSLKEQYHGPQRIENHDCR